MPEIDPLILKLIVDDKEYKVRLQGATAVVDRETGKQAQAVSNLERHTTSAMQKIGGAFSLLTKAAALTGISISALGAGMVAAIAGAIKFAKSIDDTSQKLGITTTAFQELSFAQMQLGGEQEGLERGLDALTQKLGKAGLGAKEPSKLFKTLGVDIADANGKIRNAADILPVLADRVNAIDDPMRRAAIRAELFGDAAHDMSKLLEQGGAGISDLARRAHEAGTVLSDQDIKRLLEAGEAFRRLRIELEMRMTKAVGENAAAIRGLADAFATLAEKALGAIGIMQRWNNIRILRHGIGSDNDRATAARGLVASGGQGGRDAFLGVQERRRNAIRAAAGDQAAINEANRMAAADYRAIIEARRGGKDSGASANPTSPDVSNLLSPNPRTPGKGRSGPSAADIAARHAADLARLNQEEIRARIELTDDVGERGRLERELLRAEYNERIRDIDADKHMSEEQKKAQREILDRLFGRARAEGEGEEIVVEANRSLYAQLQRRDEGRKVVEDQLAIDQATLRAETEALRVQYDLADAQSDRRRLALEILEKEDEQRIQALDAVIQNDKLYDARDRQIAAIEKATILATQGMRQEGARRGTESPSERYLRELNRSGGALGEDIDRVAIDGLEKLNDQLVDAIMNAQSLGDTFKNVANQIIADLLRIAVQQSIIKPLASALFGGGGGSGIGGLVSGAVNSSAGKVGSFVGSLFGRASGGYVPPNSVRRVNEHRGGVELIRVGSKGADVIPLGQANAAAARPVGQTIVKQTFVLDNRYGITTPQLLDRVNQIARDEAAAAGAASYQQSMKDAPNAVTQARRFASSAF